MRIVLTDKDFTGFEFPKDVEIKKVNLKSLDQYNNNSNVRAIAGSRAMAIKCADMNLSGLKLFQLTSAGFDGVPLNKYAKSGVAVANAGNVYSVPIAETVVFGMLSVAKRLRKNPNNRHFKITRGYSLITELADKKVLIMGAGNIGTAVADRLKGFDMLIDGYDPFCSEKPQYNKIIRNRLELIKSICEYDYIVSTMPDNEQTKNFINKELFDDMNSNAVIINVGRKAVFQSNDFYNALRTKKIGGAVLDMFEKIPNPVTNKFRRLSNVVVLPGVAAISKEVNIRLRKHMYENVMALLNNEPIKCVISGGND